MAVLEAIRAKDVEAAVVLQLYESSKAKGADAAGPPECPLVVFINPKSGGRHGPELKARLQDLMSEEQVAFMLMFQVQKLCALMLLTVFLRFLSEICGNF